MSSNDTKNRRFVISQTNNSQSNILCYKEWLSQSGPFIDNPAANEVYVESSIIDMSTVALQYNPNLKIGIFKGVKTPVMPLLPETMNLFDFQAFTNTNTLQSIDQLNSWFYYIFKKTGVVPNDATSSLTWGNLEINENSTFTYSLSQTEYNNAFASGDYQIWLNQELYNLIPSWCLSTPQYLGSNTTDLFYQLNTSLPVIPPQSSTGGVPYDYPTAQNLLELTRVIIKSNLPLTPSFLCRGDYFIQETLLNQYLINKETFNIYEKVSQVYQPLFPQVYTFESNLPIESFSIEIKLIYADDKEVTHILAPNEKYNIVVVFKERQ